MDNEIINLLVNSNMTWAAALTIMSIVLRPALVTLTAGLVEARRVAAKAIEARNINEVEQTKVLRSVEDALTRNTAIVNASLNLLQPLSNIPMALEEATKRMTTRADARDGMLAAQNQRLEQLHQAVANVPSEYMMRSAQHFDPQFASLQLAISELRRQIETTQDILTPGVVREIRAELRQINNFLADLNSGGKKKENKVDTQDEKTKQEQ